MSIKLVVCCDDHTGNCNQELEGYEDVDFTDHSKIPESWGKVYAHDEHYCPECWDQYCEDNDVNKKTGQYL